MSTPTSPESLPPLADVMTTRLLKDYEAPESLEHHGGNVAAVSEEIHTALESFITHANKAGIDDADISDAFDAYLAKNPVGTNLDESGLQFGLIHAIGESVKVPDGVDSRLYHAIYEALENADAFHNEPTDVWEGLGSLGDLTILNQYKDLTDKQLKLALTHTMSISGPADFGPNLLKALEVVKQLGAEGLAQYEKDLGIEA